MTHAKTLQSPTRPSAASLTTSVDRLADEVEAWLHAQPLPEAPVDWRRSGPSAVPVRSREELGIRIARLGEQGSWGVASRTNGERWGQTMRVEGGWIVEVNGVPGPECFARRVSAGGDDIVATADIAAGILWAWLAGRLLPGYELEQL